MATKTIALGAIETRRKPMIVSNLREELSSIALWGGGVAGEVTNGLQMAENVAKQKDRT